MKNWKNIFSGHDINHIQECFSDIKNEVVIKTMFLKDLYSFSASTTKANVNFKTIFRKIQNKIEESDHVTFTYKKVDICHFAFSDTLKNETLTQVLDPIKLPAPVEYALSGEALKFSEN